MDLALLRSRVREINFSLHGVPATVDGVATRIIWLVSGQDPRPAGGEFGRADPRRTMALRRDHVPEIPRGTEILVTEHLLDAPAAWVVDSTDEIRSDHIRVVVKPTIVLNRLKAYYTKDEVSGARQDSVGGYHLTDNNSVGSVAGQISNAAAFDNAGSQYLSRAGQIDLDGALGITVEGWIRVLTGAPVSAVYFFNGAFFYGWIALGTSNAGPQAMHFTVANVTESSSASVTMAYDTWHYVVGRYNRVTREPSISLDGGTPVVGIPLTAHPVMSPALVAGELTVGGHTPASFSKSHMDELAVWNKYRTEAEFAEQMALTRPF